MPKFTRDVLAKFLPQSHIAAFEQLNTAIDETLPSATATAQTTAEIAATTANQALLTSAAARGNSDVLRQILDMLTARVLTQRDSAAQVQALERRVADLETQLLALQRRNDTDLLRRQIADIQSLQVKR